MSQHATQDVVTTDAFDFTVEDGSLPAVEVVESIDSEVLTGMMTARCN